MVNLLRDILLASDEFMKFARNSEDTLQASFKVGNVAMLNESLLRPRKSSYRMLTPHSKGMQETADQEICQCHQPLSFHQ